MDLLTPQKEMQYAGFWMRFAAYLIDGFIVSFISGIIFIPISLITGVSMFSLFKDDVSDAEKAAYVFGFIGIIAVMVILVIIVQWLYYALQESSESQATLGKRAMGIIVTDLHGNRITFLNATGRHFGKIISGAIMNIGYIMAGFTEKKQALHDILANCLVIKKPLQFKLD